MKLTEADVKEIREAAESGDETAKAALAVLPKDTEPESGKAEVVEDVKVGTENTQKTEEKTEVKTEEKKVDQTQEKPELSKRETVHPAVRRIEREKREMRRIIDEQNARLEALSKKFDEAQPRKAKESEADVLNKLLADPEGYLRERDKRLIEQMQTQSIAEQKRISLEMARTHMERENALKIIGSIEGYDDKRDADAMLTATAEYLNDVYDTDRYDEDEVQQMWIANPGNLAPVMRKAWNKSRQLSDEAKSDKRAATSTAAGSGKTPSGKTPSLTDLNAKLAQANSKGDKKAQDEIMGQIATMLGEK